MGVCFNSIEKQTVYPILIKNNGKSYLSVYYYTDHSDAVLYSDTKRVLYFLSKEDMEAFCSGNGLYIENEIREYDFDVPIENPVDYGRILNNWNLLNTIADSFGMFYEGDCKKYNALYNLLFRLNTPIESIPPMYRMREKDYNHLLRVFRKKDRFLNRFELYQVGQEV